MKNSIDHWLYYDVSFILFNNFLVIKFILKNKQVLYINKWSRNLDFNNDRKQLFSHYNFL